jgi:hypothetical protein
MSNNRSRPHLEIAIALIDQNQACKALPLRVGIAPTFAFEPSTTAEPIDLRSGATTGFGTSMDDHLCWGQLQLCFAVNETPNSQSHHSPPYQPPHTPVTDPSRGECLFLLQPTRHAKTSFCFIGGLNSNQTLSGAVQLFNVRVVNL